MSTGWKRQSRISRAEREFAARRETKSGVHHDAEITGGKEINQACSPSTEGWQGRHMRIPEALFVHERMEA